MTQELVPFFSSFYCILFCVLMGRVCVRLCACVFTRVCVCSRELLLIWPPAVKRAWVRERETEREQVRGGSILSAFYGITHYNFNANFSPLSGRAGVCVVCVRLFTFELIKFLCVMYVNVRACACVCVCVRTTSIDSRPWLQDCRLAQIAH